MNSDIYRTIEMPSEGVFKDRGSRFIGLAFPVFSEEDIKEILTSLKKKYYDATHHCYAYRLGADKTTYRSNDDGEPSGSAGKPIFGQIQSCDLSNIFIVVIRYYGGVKLGVSGLINAYRSAAADALENALIIEKTEDIKLFAFFKYEAMNDVMKIIKDEKIKLYRQHFELDCKIQFFIRKNDAERITEMLQKIDQVRVDKEV
ncbi:MAG: YigZ family protein [Bacteroidetes bacterium RIFOXYA12_FULL_35_11]|nr:MAG: YigZ family protein [Bacteroidetes bacterium GWF2_35_48]OFY83577.1 MAG: YigZ family protein [Bacteroidetes bacterium RIFOXYA12_FULL_35_11]OFY95871.1 MAG: YigZ family protein [Bacteroidetes bacterium RIFOXYC12_FULL_35_7]HBX51761.1 YigZ family protein [Bacteroidales bacterium]